MQNKGFVLLIFNIEPASRATIAFCLWALRLIHIALHWMSVPRSLDGFEVTAAVARMLDQPMLWWQAVGLFVDHFADWERTWQAAIGDDVQEQKSVHALRSAAANVGAQALCEVAASLEAQLLKKRAGLATSVPENLRACLQTSFRLTWLSAAKAWKAGLPGSTEGQC